MAMMLRLLLVVLFAVALTAGAGLSGDRGDQAHSLVAAPVQMEMGGLACENCASEEMKAGMTACAGMSCVGVATFAAGVPHDLRLALSATGLPAEDWSLSGRGTQPDLTPPKLS